MADTDAVSESLIITANTTTVLSVVSAFEDYPTWLAEFKDAEILATDDQGRAQRVRFTVGAVGISLGFTLDYEHADDRISWNLVEGDMLQRLDGAYLIDAQDDGTTRLTYELEVDSSVPLPGMVRRRVAGKIVKDSLKAIKARAEAV